MQCDECMHLEGYTEDSMAMCHEFRSEGGFVKESRFLRPMPEDGDCPRFRAFRPEKESAPEWMPLDLSKPEDRELLRGKWIRSKVNDHESVVTAFKYQEYEWKAHLPQMGLKSGRTLLDDYTFLDGSPIGRKVEERPF